MRATIVGQAPGRANGARRAFDGPCGRRLAALAGLGGVGELRRRARLVNVLPEWPGPCGKGDAFPAREGRAAAARVRLGRGPVLLAGRHVAAAFGVRAPFFEWVDLRGRRAAVFPHPSGVSHWWNDPANRARAGEFLRSVLA